VDSHAVSRRWLVAGIAFAIALVLGAPFIGQLRAALRSAAGSGSSFATLMAIVVAGSAAVAVGAALLRIRDRRALRYGSIAAAVAIAVAYSLAARTGNAEVDAVERFHFIEYGLITALFYRAWRPSGDGALFVMPLLMGIAVGTLEEWLQWFIPARVGEARDVLLNTFAIGCGLLFSVGFDPPRVITFRLRPRSQRQAAILAAATIVLFGGFVHSVHLGYEIKDPEAGVFRSRYRPEAIGGVALQRAEQWRSNPPLTWGRLSREDQFFSEAVAHVRRRNEAWQEGNIMAARHENRILEKYYAPVLDAPSYVSPTGLRWPEEQRAVAEGQTGPGFMIYVSDGYDYPIVTWPKWSLWLVVLVSVLLLLRAVPARA
jgi:hypothetical protein